MVKFSLKLLISASLLASGLVYASENKDCDSLNLRGRVLTKIGYSPTNIGVNNISSFCSYTNWLKAQLK